LNVIITSNLKLFSNCEAAYSKANISTHILQTYEKMMPSDSHFMLVSYKIAKVTMIHTSH